jgi:hypothetical protein
MKTSARLRSVLNLLPLLAAARLAAYVVAPSWELPPPQQREGGFWREHWYERGWTNGAPFEKRFRVNPPELSLHPLYGRRVEAKENGLMLVRVPEDLYQLTGAEYVAELWGGHPGTAGKRVSVNGRLHWMFPRTGTEDGHCTYTYPVVPLRITDLVNGWNAFQWSLEQGTTFWGHALVNEACVRVALTNSHPDLARLGLTDFRPQVVALAADEQFGLELEGLGAAAGRISEVVFQAWYAGYDENGNLRGTDWHGFTQDRRPVGHLTVPQ